MIERFRIALWALVVNVAAALAASIVGILVPQVTAISGWAFFGLVGVFAILAVIYERSRPVPLQWVHGEQYFTDDPDAEAKRARADAWLTQRGERP